MALPSWMLDNQPKIAPLRHELASSIRNAPGWRIVGDDHYTAIPVPGYEVNPDILRAIRVFDPGAIPLWRKQLWLTPGKNDSPELFVHHVIARWVQHPKSHRLRLTNVELPADWRGPVPNVIDSVLEIQDCDRVLKRGGPGLFVAWDDWLEKFCRRSWEEVSLKRFDAKMKALRESRKAAAALAWEDLEARRVDLDDWIARQKESGHLTRQDWYDYERKRIQIIAGKARAMAFLNGGLGPTLSQEVGA